MGKMFERMVYVWAVAMVLGFGVLGGAIYVAVHFIQKFW